MAPAATSSPVTLRPLTADDVEAYVALRRRALAEEPLVFVSSPEDDLASSVVAVRAQIAKGPSSIIVGAFTDRLVGTAGLYRDPHRKAAHKAHLWGMYVHPEARGRGVAAALLRALIAHAQGLPGVEWVRLTVTSAAPGARRLYERAGFEVWATEPDALRHAGRSVDDHEMALRLPAAGAGA